MAAFDARSLPGVFFDVQPRVLEEKLPRMDIAVFVGFAAQGELHTPTVVEDAEQFATLFGDDLPLAWDAERGDYVYAYLPSSVRAFFRNGGRRCWIVRVPTPEPDQFTADVFLDSRLKETGVERLIPDADFIRYQGDQQQWLTGIHAVLESEADEATLIAVPDAIHRGWRVATPSAPTPPAPSLPPLRPEWWRFLDCNPPPSIEPVHEPQWGNFLDCRIRVLPPPQLSASSTSVETGVFTLSWTFNASDAGAQYMLEEALFPNFSDAVVIYEGVATVHELYGRAPADYYYRVRAAVEGNVSDWSAGIVVRVAPGPRLEVKSPSEYSEATLLTIHSALLRLCAARGDLFAVLTLPEHYHEYEAISHAGQLRQTVEFAPPGTAPSYGALYHPWLIGREEIRPAALRSTPPCGAVCGVFAYRAFTRGAWVAPANEPLRGVMALTPTLSRDRWSGLQEAQVNVIRQEPQGFLVLDADTLDKNGDFTLINVRRLISILRRLALQLGVTYVFEPNDAAFRRAVKRGFEARLEQMFIRGAFAGDTPATSYQVVVEDPVNTPQSVEQGRFIVELKVAPSVPLRFLTVRLEQTGERGLVLEGR